MAKDLGKPDLGSAADFRQWLVARANKRVGYVKRTASCPVANYLRSINARRLHVCISTGGMVVTDEDDFTGKMYDTPEWIAYFVEGLDTLCEPGAVDGKAALSVLEAANGR